MSDEKKKLGDKDLSSVAGGYVDPSWQDKDCNKCMFATCTIKDGVRRDHCLWGYECFSLTHLVYCGGYDEGQPIPVVPS